MKIVDITGRIYSNMWHYEVPFPNLSIKTIKQPDWVEYKVFMEEFKGMCSQTGTYLETPAHFLGYEDSYKLIDININKLIDINAYVIDLDLKSLKKENGRFAITLESLEKNTDENLIKESKAILISTGWGKFWESSEYLNEAPFFKFEAMEWLISKKPFLIGSDSPRWENIAKPEKFFSKFFNSNILMLAPCVNIEKIRSEKVLLTVLPIKIDFTCAAPCRAFVKY